MSGKKDQLLPKKGGDLLVECLLNENVKYLFGIPGGHILEIYDAVYRWGREKGIDTIMVRHEQAGAHAADAYARATGEIGVCFGTVGPGVLDMVPGVGAAWGDNVPLIVLGGQIKRMLDGKSSLQGDLDQITLMKPITKAQFQIQKAEEIPEIISRAIRTALTGRTGPVYIDIRQDALEEVIPPDTKVEIIPPEKYRPKVSILGDPSAITEAVELIKTAKKPILICGSEVTAFNASEEAKKLSEKFSIPAGSSVGGIGTISGIPTHLGATIASDTLTNAAMYSDLVISVGCRWNWTLGFGMAPLWSKNQKLIQINLDPTEIGKNRSVDVAILGDSKTVLNQLIKEMEAKLPKEKINEWAQWNQEQQEYKQMQLKRNVRKMNSDKIPILPQRFVKELLEFFPSDGLVAADGGDVCIFALEQIDLHKPTRPRSILFPVNMGHLGVGIPYAIGAKLAFPDKQVGVLMGDGSFLFNIQELETAVRYNLPIIIVIGNNSCWGMIKTCQAVSFKKRHIDVDFPEIDYVKIAQGFGCYAERVTNPDDIKPALQRAVDSNKPAVIDVVIEFSMPKGTKVMANLGLL
jgi:acetolactate synthase-1/2/3 large subunit